MKKLRPITEKQKDVLRFIQNYRDQFGYPPSTRDIQRGFEHKSQTAAQRYLEVLRKKGYISSSEGRARAYKVLKEL